MRIGFGYDVHAFAPNRKLWLGGICVPYELGLDGHSDADVLIHALCDAILGAAAMRDIGYHFPDNSNDFKNIDSRILLRKTRELLAKNNWQIGNVDATICCQRPKLLPHIPAMCQNIAEDLQIEVDAVSVKATTTEKLGFVGREEGVAVFAVALITKE